MAPPVHALLRRLPGRVRGAATVSSAPTPPSKHHMRASGENEGRLRPSYDVAVFPPMSAKRGRGASALFFPIAGRTRVAAETRLCLCRAGRRRPRCGSASTLAGRRAQRLRCRHRHRELCDGGPSKALVRRRVYACLLMGDRSSARFGGRRRSSPPWDQHRRPARTTASIRALARRQQARDARLWRGAGLSRFRPRDLSRTQSGAPHGPAAPGRRTRARRKAGRASRE
jgi:hypothetical protein